MPPKRRVEINKVRPRHGEPSATTLRELVRYGAELVCLRTNRKLQVYAVLAKEGVNVAVGAGVV